MDNAVLIDVEHVPMDIIYAIVVMELIKDIKVQMISAFVKTDL
jgi:hypothetical protein